jgi:hypothetical protein
MNIAFTICSNNYLAHAKTLGDSFLAFHPDAKFIIGLVDQYHPELDYDFYKAFDFIPVEDIRVPGFDELNAKYDITELNTAVKPAYLHYIFKKYAADKLLYIDPDILVTSSFDEVFDLLDSKNIVITPHMCSPVDDEFEPNDYHILRGGVYNLGFIGLSNYEIIHPFISWWHDRVVKYGFEDIHRGMFYDQLWISYVPVFYDNYYILKHPGYNMANWNLHERSITSQDNGQYILNNQYPLRFFHFSSYKYYKPEVICAYLTRYDFDNRPDLVAIFKTYREKLKENKIDQISKLKVFYYPDLYKVNNGSKKKLTYKGLVLRIKRAGYILING